MYGLILLAIALCTELGIVAANVAANIVAGKIKTGVGNPKPRLS